MSARYLDLRDRREDAIPLGPVDLGGTSFTVQVWVYAHDLGGASRTVLGLVHGNAGPDLNLSIWNGRLAFLTDSGPVRAEDGTDLQTARWTHVAWSHDHDAGTVDMYVDGVHVGGGRSGGLSQPGQPAALGAGSDSDHFHGALFGLRIDPSAMSAEQIAADWKTLDVRSDTLLARLDGTDPAPPLPEAEDRWRTITDAPPLGPTAAPPAAHRPPGPHALRFAGTVLPPVPLGDIDLARRSFTVEMWVWPEFDGDRERQLLGSDQGEPNTHRLLHLVLRDRKPYLGFFRNDTASRTVLPERTWTHLAFRYDAETRTQSILVDGRLDVQGTDKPPLESAPPVMLGGAGSSDDQRMHGCIQELRVWDHVRTPAQVVATLHAPLQGDETGLLRHHPLGTDDPLLAGIPTERIVLVDREGPAAWTALRARLEGELAAQTEARATAEAAHMAAGAALSAEQAARTAADARVAELTADKADLEATIAALRSEVSALTGQVGALQDEVAGLEAQLKEGPQPLSDCLERLSTEVDKASTRIAARTGFELGRVSLDLKVVPTGDGGRILFPDPQPEEGEAIEAARLSRMSVELAPAPAAAISTATGRAVPDLVGRSGSYARELLGQLELTADIVPSHIEIGEHGAADLGRVLAQQPAAGTAIPLHAPVTLFVGTAG